MAFTRLINDLAIIAALDNLPNATSGLTAAQLKAKFDEAAGLIKTYLNNTLAAELEATTDGDSGLDNMGMTAIGSYTNPQLFLEYLYSTLGALSPAPQSLERQAIINSNMEVAQRGTSFTIATAASAYTIDRFKSVNLGSGVSASVSQSSITDLDGSTNGLRMIHAGTPTAQGKLSHVYTMEAKDSYKLAGRQVTFSIKALGVGLMRFVTINARYKTSSSAISNSDTLIGTIDGSARSDFWQTTTLTVTLPTRATLTENGVIGIEIIASKLTPESNGDGFIIAQLSLNTGAAALPFQPRSFAEELAMCQRYYYHINNDATASTMGIGSAYGTTASNISVQLPKMRVFPTLLISSIADFSLSEGISAFPITGLSITTSITSSSLLILNASGASGLTQFRLYYLQFASVGASKFIAFNAEL